MKISVILVKFLFMLFFYRQTKKNIDLCLVCITLRLAQSCLSSMVLYTTLCNIIDGSKLKVGSRTSIPIDLGEKNTKYLDCRLHFRSTAEVSTM